MYTIDLQPFKDFMGTRNLVPEKYRTFYVNWVRRFLLSEFNAQELAAKDKITQNKEYRISKVICVPCILLRLKNHGT